MPRSRDEQARRVAAIGQGRFDQSVARTRHELRHEATAIDVDERSVGEMSEVVALAAQGDGTDEELLRSLQVERSAVAIVAWWSVKADSLSHLNRRGGPGGAFGARRR